MKRATATTAKPLSVKERRARAAEIAKDAPARVRAGIALLDFREATAKERAVGEKLATARRGARAA